MTVISVDSRIQMSLSIILFLSSCAFVTARSVWLVSLLQTLSFLLSIFILAGSLHYNGQPFPFSSKLSLNTAKKFLWPTFMVLLMANSVLILLLSESTQVTRSSTWVLAYPAIVTSLHMIVCFPILLLLLPLLFWSTAKRHYTSISFLRNL
jgi:hypothetical protein